MDYLDTIVSPKILPRECGYACGGGSMKRCGSGRDRTSPVSSSSSATASNLAPGQDVAVVRLGVA